MLIIVYCIYDLVIRVTAMRPIKEWTPIERIIITTAFVFLLRNLRCFLVLMTFSTFFLLQSADSEMSLGFSLSFFCTLLFSKSFFRLCMRSYDYVATTLPRFSSTIRSWSADMRRLVSFALTIFIFRFLNDFWSVSLFWRRFFHLGHCSYHASWGEP